MQAAAAAVRGSSTRVTAAKRQSRNGVYDYYDAPRSVDEHLRRILRDVKSALIPSCPLDLSAPFIPNSVSILRVLPSLSKSASIPPFIGLFIGSNLEGFLETRWCSAELRVRWNSHNCVIMSGCHPFRSSNFSPRRKRSDTLCSVSFFLFFHI